MPEMKRLLTFIAAVLCFGVAGAKQYELSSPSGVLKVTIDVDDALSYSLSVDGKVVMDDCALSMTLADGRVLGAAPKVSKVRKDSRTETIVAPMYRQSSFEVSYNILNVVFSGGWTLEFRAYDDGIAYRFVTDFKDGFDVRDEQVEFRFTEDYELIIPYSDKRKDKYASSFESQYTFHKLSEKPYDDRFAFTPLLVDMDDSGWLLLMEADLIDYPGMFIERNATADGLTAVFPKARLTQVETMSGSLNAGERKDVIACGMKAEETFPWRIVAYAADGKDLPMNNMVYQLATPCKIDDVSWIRPGKSTWDWWNGCKLYGVDFRAGNNTETYMYHIDFASEYGIEYVMIDDGWYSFRDKDMLNPRADLNLPKLCEYAEKKGVGIILWAVGHTLVKDAEKICEHYAKMGVAGFKVDFFESQDQEVVRDLYTLAEVTAKYNLLIDMHGVYKPTGLSRTWPNVINFEGVYGLEQMKWTDKDKADMPLNDVLVPYIRMACGPLDYTPGAMVNAAKRDYRSIDHMGMSQGTRAHQIALYVVFDAPLAMLCDTPSNYIREDECTRFISAIPTVYDRSVVLEGKVGESIVMGRLKDGVWYVGGLTSWEPRDIALDCSFLEEGEWTAEIIRDGVNSDRHGSDYKKETVDVSATSVLPFHLAPGGGFAAVFKKK